MQRRSTSDAQGYRARNSFVQSVLEPLESRNFRSVTVTDNDSITDLSNYSYFGGAAFGDNGDWSGAAGIGAGTTDGEQGWTERVWDDDLSDGLDSGWVNTEFEADNSAGNVSWSLSDADAVTFSSGSTANVSSVIIRAGVEQGGLTATWRNIYVNFYHGSTLGEQISVGTLTADTSTATTNDPKEAYVTVTPTGSGYNHVVVMGDVRFQSVQGVYPGAGDVFCQVLVQ